MSADGRVNQIVGKNIQRLRTRRAMTRVALARKAGLDDSYLGKMERGQRGTSSGGYERIARALGVDLPELFQQCSRRRSAAPSSNA